MRPSVPELLREVCKDRPCCAWAWSSRPD